jgi:hypothetical protein
MVVMDIVEDGFSFMQRHRSRRSLHSYHAARLPAWTRRLQKVERYLNRHNIQMAAEQFLIQPVCVFAHAGPRVPFSGHPRVVVHATNFRS